MSPNLHPGPFYRLLEACANLFICREQGCRSNNFQSLVDSLVGTLLESDGPWGKSGKRDLPSYRENILKAQSRRSSPPRHEKLIRVGRTLLDSLCMRNGHGKELGKGADNLPQEQRGSKSCSCG